MPPCIGRKGGPACGIPRRKNIPEMHRRRTRRSGFDILEQSGLNITWSPPTQYGHKLCAINGTGCPVNNCYCNRDSMYWNFYLKRIGYEEMGIPRPYRIKRSTEETPAKEPLTAQKKATYWGLNTASTGTRLSHTGSRTSAQTTEQTTST